MRPLYCQATPNVMRVALKRMENLAISQVRDLGEFIRTTTGDLGAVCIKLQPHHCVAVHLEQILSVFAVGHSKHMDCSAAAGFATADR